MSLLAPSVSCLSRVPFHSIGKLDFLAWGVMLHPNPELKGKARASWSGVGTGAPGALTLKGSVEVVTQPTLIWRESVRVDSYCRRCEDSNRDSVPLWTSSKIPGWQVVPSNLRKHIIGCGPKCIITKFISNSSTNLLALNQSKFFPSFLISEPLTWPLSATWPFPCLPLSSVKGSVFCIPDPAAFFSSSNMFPTQSVCCSLGLQCSLFLNPEPPTT